MKSKDQILLEEAYSQIYKEKLEFNEDVNINYTQKNNTIQENANFKSNDSHLISEKFTHGIQPINEAKNKVNPWAIEKSIEKKTGKKFDKKHKEEIVKGIKKTAKKTGKKITSDKVKPKKK